jgi:PAS domain S-box-containing protein
MSGKILMSVHPERDQIQLDKIFQNVPIGMGLVDDLLRIISTNSALLTILEYRKEQLQDLCFSDLCHPEDRKKLERLFERSRQVLDLEQRQEVRLQCGDGSYTWAEISVGLNPPGNELPGQYLVIFQEIQRQKEMELEVAELHRRLNDRAEKQQVQLAQELHDGAMQDLHSIQYQLSALQNTVQGGAQDQVEGVMDTVRQVQRELRRISYDLRPPTITRFGLSKAIRSHAEEFIENHPEFSLVLDLVDDSTKLTEEIRLALYRIYQQAIGNILQHSGASEIEVSLRLEGNDVELWIRDDGRGFDVPERWISLVRGGHYGLAGSQDRVSSLGGEFQVKSESGQGTEILVRIPDVVEVKE